MKLSAVVITKNEEKNIRRCLQALSFTDERIVIDAESTDNTVAIAKELGAMVYVNPWPGYGLQKNFGLLKAQGQWVLFVDADEEVSSTLSQEIMNAITSGTHNFYWLKIVTVFLGQKLRHLYGHNPRLFKKSSGRWNEAFVHEQVQHIDEEVVITLGDSHSKKLQEPLLHHSHPTITSYLKSMHQYTALDAKEMAATDKHRSGRPVKPTFLLPPKLAIRQFIKLLFYRRGFLDGLPGLIWCTLSAYYEWEMGYKYLSLKAGK